MTVINLDSPSVEVRERRLGSVSGYEGDAQDLVEKGWSHTLKNNDRSFHQCMGCSTYQAACTAILIQDAAVISHGPVGCSACFYEYAFTYRLNAPGRGIEHPTQRKIYSTNLTEKDTIYGGVAKLRKTIEEVFERADPHVIFVLTTCTSGIIGDDVESVADEEEQKLGIPIVAVFCEGFRSRVWTSGFDAGYHGIARKLIKPAQKKTNKINVINFWGKDVFGEWFRRFGYEPNYITPYSTLNTLEHSSESALTVEACATLGSYLATALEQVYGVPQIKSAPPYGIAQTDRWFRELGQVLHKEDEVEAFLKEQKEKYLPAIEKLRYLLKGKTVFVTAGSSYGQSLLAVMKELGMNTVGAALFHHDPEFDGGDKETDALAHLVKDYGNVPSFNVCSKQEFEIVNQLHRLHPDIMLARHNGMTQWGAKFGIPSLLIGDEHLAMGYEGIVTYGKLIYHTINNNEFVTNIHRHAVTPYTDWWMEQDPAAFQKKRGAKA